MHVPRSAHGHRLVSPSGSPVVSTLEQIFGTAGIARVEVTPGGGWDVEHDGWTDVIWDTETTVNEGPDQPHSGPHEGCAIEITHRHPEPAYDQFMTRDGFIVLRKDIRLERWDEASGRWVTVDRA